MPTQQRGRPTAKATSADRNKIPDHETRICITIDREMWKAFKLECVKNDKTFKAVLTSLIEKYLSAKR